MRRLDLGRLRSELLERVESFSDRILEVAQALDEQRRYVRIIDQLVGSGTGVGANLYEADQAMSTRDFMKCVGIAVKELNESKFWLRTIARRMWIKPDRLQGLLAEADELLAILNSIIIRTRTRVSNDARSSER